MNIPKIFHQIWYNFRTWGEPQQVPRRYDRARESWSQKNPGWVIRLWNEKESEQLMREHYPGWFRTFRQLEKPIQKADFFRWVALYHFGGCYIDMDCTCLQPLGVLLKKYDGDNVVILPDHRWAMNAMIFSTPRHPIVCKLLNAVSPASVFGSDSMMGIFCSTGPIFVRRQVSGQPGVVLEQRLMEHTPGREPGNAPSAYIAQHSGAGSWGYKELVKKDINRVIAAALVLILVLLLIYLVWTRVSPAAGSNSHRGEPKSMTKS